MKKFIKRWGIRSLSPFLHVYWFIFRPTTFGAKVLIERGRKLLFIRHTYQPRFWTLPGGGIKRGESDYNAARREVEEELSMKLTSLTRLGEIESLLEWKHDHISIFRATTNDEPVIDGVEIAEAGWFDEHHIPVLGPVTQLMYNRYKDAQ